MKSKDFIASILTSAEHALTKRTPNIVILCYHSVSDEKTIVDVAKAEFYKQISWLLDNHIRFVSLDEVVSHKKQGIAFEQPSVALTFDDGYQDLITNVAPLLSRYQIPATLFALADAKHADRYEMENSKRLLNKVEILTLRKMGWTIASHGLTHSDLLKNEQNSETEIKNSKSILSAMIHAPISYFAYPKGHFNRSTLSMVCASGYEAAFSFSPGFVMNSNIFSIPRLGVDHTHSLAQFSAFFTFWGNYYLMLKNLWGRNI